MDTYDEYEQYLNELEKIDEKYKDGDIDEADIKHENEIRQKMYFNNKHRQGDIPKEKSTTPDTVEDWVNYLAMKCHLDTYNADDLLHDINNGRGDEWLTIFKHQNVPKDVIEKYKQFIGYEEEEYEEEERD